MLPSKTQWRSQDIAVARAQHGHTSTLRLYALPREVQKLIGGSEGIPPPPPPPPPQKKKKNLGILQPPKSVLRPYRGAN